VLPLTTPEEQLPPRRAVHLFADAFDLGPVPGKNRNSVDKWDD